MTTAMPMPPGAAQQPGEPQSAPDIARYAVASAIWAPSVHNTQPWWFRVGGQQLSLHADRGRRLLTADPDGRELLISCGAALFNARLALRALGLVPHARVLPDARRPHLVAQVRWPEAAPVTEYEQRLFGQVPRRRTHRGGFAALPLSAGLLAELQRWAQRDRTKLHIITDPGQVAVIASAVQDAERAMQSSGPYVRELASWTRPPGSTAADGVPATAYPARADQTWPQFPGRDFAHGHRWGLPTASWPTAKSAGVLCVLATAEDRPPDWIAAGQALQRLLLACADAGVAAAIHSQPIELAEQRAAVRALLAGGGYPQLVFRLGTVIQAAVSVRRPPEDVLFEDQPPAARAHRAAAADRRE